MPTKKHFLLSLLVVLILLPCFVKAGELGDALKNKEGNTVFLEAIDLYLAEQYDDAIVKYNEALKVSPDDAFVHNFLAHALRKAGKVDEAIEEYKAALKINPKYAYAHNNLGEALLEKELFDEAIAEFTLAIKCDGRHELAARNIKKAKAIQAEKNKK